MKKIVVASKNPVKINATLDGFIKMFPEETFQGAWNRAENVSRAIPVADFWVGLEGGVEEKNGEMVRRGSPQVEAFAWVAIKGKNGKFGKGRTGTFFLPPKIAELIRQGKELGEADDIVFKRENSKQENGAVGILTGDVLNRANHYAIAVIMALIPFKNEELY